MWNEKEEEVVVVEEEEEVGEEEDEDEDEEEDEEVEEEEEEEEWKEEEEEEEEEEDKGMCEVEKPVTYLKHPSGSGIAPKQKGECMGGKSILSSGHWSKNPWRDVSLRSGRVP